MNKLSLLILTSVFFLAGTFSWLIFHNGDHTPRNRIVLKTAGDHQEEILVDINGESITRKEVEMEYKILTSALEKKGDITFIYF